MSYNIVDTSLGKLFYSFEIRLADNDDLERVSLIISNLENMWSDSISAAEARHIIPLLSPIDVQAPKDLKGYFEEIKGLLGLKIENIKELHDTQTEVEFNVEDDEGLFKWKFHLKKLNGTDKVDGIKQLANDIWEHRNSLESRSAKLEKLIVQKDYHIQNLLKQIGGVSHYSTREYRDALNVYKKE